jgi:predicted transposase/invertase (TIGR01784 family)
MYASFLLSLHNRKTKQIQSSMQSSELIRFDYAMKKLLRNKANFGVLEGFIEVIFGKKCKIQAILESDGNQDTSEEKFNRVDVKAQDEDGEIFVVEVQTSRYTYFLERILFGVSNAVTEQVRQGEDYDRIKKVYSIAIVYYDFGEGSDYIYRGTTEFRGVRTGDILRVSRKEELTEEELAKEQEKDELKRRKYKLKKQTVGDLFPEFTLLRINAFRPSIANALEEWMTFLKDNSIKDDTSVPGLVEAKEVLKRSNMTEAERAIYLRHIEAMRNEKSATDYSYASGKVDGRAEGIAEGAKQQAIATARKMLSKGFSIDEISEMTGLAPDEITAL